jgi:hypothetical protein
MSATDYITGSSQSAGNSIVLPSHQPGDVILIGAVRNGSTSAPLVPSPFVQLTTTGGSGFAMSVAYLLATASNHTSGTFTNASLMVAAVLRGTNALAGRMVASSAAATNTATISAGAGTGEFIFLPGFVVGFTIFGAQPVTLTSPPSGYTVREQIATAGTSTFALFLGPSAARGSSLGSASITPGQTLNSWRNITVAISDTGVSRGGPSRPVHPMFQQVIG